MRENKKVIIPAVGKVTWDTGEMCEFASCLVAAMEALGETLPYWYVMGTSGAAFRFTLDPSQWEFSNYGIRNIAPDRYAPVQRACVAAGTTHTIVEPGAFQEDAVKIMGSLERGIPVLAFGVVGPSDCCILTGYDEGGEVLLGWSTYQDIADDHNIPHDPSGYFRKPGWHANLHGYILIGEKVSRPPQRTVYLDALQWAVYLMRLPGMGRKVTGLDGLQAWAEEMTRPVRVYPEQEEAYFVNFYLNTAIYMTMLRDHCLAETFLLEAIKILPDYQAELAQAADCYAQVRRIRDSMDTLIADNFSPQALHAIKVPKIRRQYAEAILRIRALEAEAMAHIEDCLM